jgi:hypothetical protein
MTSRLIGDGVSCLSSSISCMCRLSRICLSDFPGGESFGSLTTVECEHQSLDLSTVLLPKFVIDFEHRIPLPAQITFQIDGETLLATGEDEYSYAIDTGSGHADCLCVGTEYRSFARAKARTVWKNGSARALVSGIRRGSLPGGANSGSYYLWRRKLWLRPSTQNPMQDSSNRLRLRVPS